MILNDFSAKQTKNKSALARRNLTNLTNLTNNIKRLCTILNDLSDFSAKQTKKKSALARRLRRGSALSGRNLPTDDKPRAIKLA